VDTGKPLFVGRLGTPTRNDQYPRTSFIRSKHDLDISSNAFSPTHHVCAPFRPIERIFPKTKSTIPRIVAHEIMSTTKFRKLTCQGEYSGATIRRISQANGYPYQLAPSSMGGVLEARPVNRAIATPPVTAKTTILAGRIILPGEVTFSFLICLTAS